MKRKKQKNVAKTALIFSILKIVELSLVVFLPYFMGILYGKVLNNLSNTPFEYITDPGTFSRIIELWGVGVLACLTIFMAGVLIFLIGLLLFMAVGAFIQLNWNWAKKLSGESK